MAILVHGQNTPSLYSRKLILRREGFEWKAHTDYVHPLAIKVMQKAGIDISQHTSKHLSQYIDQKIETVITV